MTEDWKKQHRGEYLLVGGPVEVFRSQDFNNFQKGLVVYENRTEQRLFSFEALGRKL